jgi:hypothetical protein
MLSGGTRQSGKKGRPTATTRYNILCAGTQNRFVSGTSLIFVPGTKLTDNQDLVNGENFEHWMLTELL